MANDFLNLHVLYTTSVANPNRDDTGAPKQVTYGGQTRSRMSSQALTRAKRMGYELDTGGDQESFRAKAGIVDKAVTYAADAARHAEQPLSEDETQKITTEIRREIEKLVKSDKKKQETAKSKADKQKGDRQANDPEEAPSEDDPHGGGELDDGKKDTLVWLAEPELRTAARKTLAKVRGQGEDLEFIERSGYGGRTRSLSIAAFGRMFAFRPDLQNEAAIQRGHAFTTHAADIEPDYFTAVNDLSEPDEGRGAGHLAINQFTGGVYYWHCNIDRHQLWTTWIADTDEATTRARLACLFTALLTCLPSGKQATAAYKTLPDAVLAVEATGPVALHQGFERPVQADRRHHGYREPSLAALLDTQTRMARFRPTQFGPQRLATVLDTTPPDTVQLEPNLEVLIDACVSWVLAGRVPAKS